LIRQPTVCRRLLSAYLDVWERHITSIEDADIREKALGGPDTATRAKVLWQVKTTVETSIDNKTITRDNVLNFWTEWIENWQPKNRGLLKAQGKQSQTGEANKTPCIISPEARFRGAENQLYCVEIHSGDYAKGSGKTPTATFKWSRENGSVIYPISNLAVTSDGTATTTTVTLEHLDGFTVCASEGDWVEILDDDYVLQVGIGSTRVVEKLFKIIKIDPINRQVVLEGKPSSSVGTGVKKPRFLRRWDHKVSDPKTSTLELADNGALVLKRNEWLTLEEGVQIMFEETPPTTHKYRRGDYWLIPARTGAIGDVEWPQNEETTPDGQEILIPRAVPPHGVDHHFAPLAIIPAAGAAINTRRQFSLTITEPTAAPVTPEREVSLESETATRKAARKAGKKNNGNGA
jgi:hypothetical protein